MLNAQKQTNEFYRESAKAIGRYVQQELKLVPGRHFQIARVTNAPRIVAVSIRINPRYYGKLAAMTTELSLATKLDANAQIRVGRGRGGAVTLEIPKPKNLCEIVRPWHLPQRRGVNLPVGIDTERAPVYIDLSATMTPHWLLAGATGSGKSNAARLMIERLARQNPPSLYQPAPPAVSMILIDTAKRGRAWHEFARLPHLLHPIVETAEDAACLLGWTLAEMDRRAELARAGGRLHHLVVAIDEIQDLLSERPELSGAIDKIASVGREWNVHLLAATQNPTKDTLKSATAKRNMARLVGRVADSVAAFAATNVRDSGAESLTASGDMLVVTPDGISRVAVALMDSDTIASLPRLDNEPQRLDLAGIEDVDMLADMLPAASGPDPLEPEQVALALATGAGIVRLSKRLGIGKAKAKRVKDFSDSVRMAWQNNGYPTVPAIPLDEYGALSSEIDA